MARVGYTVPQENVGWRANYRCYKVAPVIALLMDDEGNGGPRFARSSASGSRVTTAMGKSLAADEDARPRHLRVFLSSPQDVADERAIAVRVLSRLPYDPFLRGRVTLEIVAWDGPGGHVPMTATSTPQAAIDQGLARPSECDVVLVILWNRMGTPLPDTYRRVDGTRYGSERSGNTRRRSRPVSRRRSLSTAVSIQGVCMQTEMQRSGTSANRSSDSFSRFKTPTDHPWRGQHVRRPYTVRNAAGVSPARDPASSDPATPVHEGQVIQPSRLDAATPAQAALEQAITVDVQLCQPDSRGLLRNRAVAGPDAGNESTQTSSSQIPLVFRREGGTLLPAIVHVDVVAPHHEPVRSTQSVLLPASQDSPVSPSASSRGSRGGRGSMWPWRRTLLAAAGSPAGR